MADRFEIHLYDTKQREKVRFLPSVPGRVGLYVCGPTVYSDAHLGHAKTQIAFDIIRRYFEYAGYQVRMVSNITDVGHITDETSDEGHDRIGARARLEQLEPMEVADKYFWSYADDMARLNLRRPSVSPRATGHIPEQIALISELIARGHAYQAAGSVYFRVASWPAYGQLSHRDIDELTSGTREEVRGEKEDPRDFALWKRAEPSHLMRWDSPWGVGFPGWHIECSAMSLKYLGDGFDIHGGGLDLQFPHHEAEIAQAEAAGHPFARYWMHANLLTVGGEKMSKSRGNFVTLKELLSRHDPMAVRLLLLQSHYRSVAEFNEVALSAAAQAYARLRGVYQELLRRLGDSLPEPSGEEWLAQAAARCRADFERAMNDDFNTPEALAALFGLAREVASALQGQPQPAELAAAARTFRQLGEEVFGLFAETQGRAGEELVSGLLDLILEQRTAYRERRQWAESDRLRARLEALGVTVEDGQGGSRWKLAQSS
jgi:cysteinyl-tRNA synthetase